MAGALQQVVSSFNYWVPPGIGRQILFSSVILTISSQAVLSFRDQRTLYELKDRIKNEGTRFVEWITKPYAADQISILKESPKQVLRDAYLTNLICKVGVAVACYLTIDASIYTSLVTLASQSDKISKLALPILEKIGSLPVPSLVNYARFIALVPAVIELLRYALVRLQIDHSSSFITGNILPLIEALEKNIGTLSNGLEILWNLRFTVICLGASQTIFHSAIQGLSHVLLTHFLPDLDFISAQTGDAIANFIKVLQFGGFAPWPFDKMAHILPTIGFLTGLTSTYRSFFSSHPYNIQKLEELFTAAQALDCNLDNLKTYHDSIRNLHDQINAAHSQGTISKAHAESLNSIVYEKCQTILETLLQSRVLESTLAQDELCNEFKLIYGSTGLVRTGAFAWDTFKGKTLQINKLDWSMDKLAELNKELEELVPALKEEVKDRNLSPQQLQFFQKYLSKKMKEFYQKNVQPNSEKDDVDFWEKNEAELRKIFGVAGFLSEVDASGETFVLQHRFHFTLFNLNVKWYLANQQSLDANHQKVCEQLLYQQAKRDKVFELGWDQMLKIPAFEGYLREREIRTTEKNKTICHLVMKDFFNRVKIFDHIQQGFVVPTGFKFVTVYLPLGSAILRLSAAKSKNLMNANHLPDTAIPLFDHEFVPNEEGRKLLKEESDNLTLADRFFRRQHEKQSHVYYSDFKKIQQLDLSPLPLEASK